jgi:hypothetical protein
MLTILDPRRRYALLRNGEALHVVRSDTDTLRKIELECRPGEWLSSRDILCSFRGDSSTLDVCLVCLGRKGE